MKKFLSVIVVCLSLLAFATSCNEDPVSQEIVEYSTPTIKGTISIPEGSGISPESIYVKVVDPSNNTVTVKRVNSDSSFVVENLSADTKYKLLFTSREPDSTNRGVKENDDHHGVGCWMHDVVPEKKEGKDIGRVKLKTLGSIKGKALVDKAEEHYDTTVYIPGTSFAAITEKDGSFTIYDVPDGTYTLRYSHEGCVAVMKENVILVCPDDSENPVKVVEDVTLISNKGTVEGKAVIGDKVDSSGIVVKLESLDKSLSYTSSTSSDGSYNITGVTPGKYRVIASYSTYQSEMTDYFTVEAATITTVPTVIELLEEYGIVSGSASIADSENKEGIQILIKSSSDSYSVITDADGTFTKKVKPSVYSVTAYKVGYSSATLDDITVRVGDSVTLSIPELISTSASVTGFVTLEGSSDNSGATITLTDSSDSTNTFVELSGSDGSFRITGITKGGTYLLTYSKDGYVSNLSNSVDVTVGKVSTVPSVTLKSVMSTVSGKVLLSGASSHENITILLKNSTNQYTASTDQNGEYKINRVLPGTYTLMASKDGYVTALTNEFVIESSSEKEVELLTLSVAIRSITGSVKLELLTDYAGALVTATNIADSTEVYSAITNSAGVYTLAGMTPGEYSIVISYTGYRTTTLETVNVVSSTVTTIPLTEISINRGTISGVAELEGRSSSAGVKVELLRGSSVYKTIETDSSGNYSFYVPQGNYTGVRYSYTDFAPLTLSKELALFADNYISMGNNTLTATHNSVYGSVDVLTTDDESNVTISFDGGASIESYTTSSDGSFRFEHVPVGSYTLRLRRQDCSDITISVEVKAADGINLGKIEVTPNTATIKGKVNLENGLSLSKVKVSVDMGSGKVLETLTDDSGRYEIGGVSIADEYTVTYSKNGWDSKTQKISPKLEKIEVREMDEITLVDTTSPVISSVVINSGANTTDNKKITLNITAADEGSGLEKIMVTYDNNFDRATRCYDYSSIFNWELPAENGTYTVYVKVVDRSGNVSESSSASIKLTDQKTEVSGVLSGDKLTWTVDKSPYLVTGSVMVEEGSTLTINPGVDVQFAGYYGITVEGTLKAEGTEENKIKFYGVDDGVDNWIGINCRNNSGSVLKYIDVDGTRSGLQGYMTVFNADIETGYYALQGYNGELCNSTVTGSIDVESSTLTNNTFNLKSDSRIMYALLTDNLFKGSSVSIYGVGENNYFSNMTLTLYSSNLNTTFDSCKLSVYGSFFACEFKECSFSGFNPTIVNGSNFIDCGGINITTSFSTYEEVDLTLNFWGYANTEELDTNGEKKQHSFMRDYYADPTFSITKANLSDYRKEPNKDAGYKGDGYHSYPAESTTTYTVGDTGPAGGIIFYDKGYYSNGWRYLEAAPSDVDTSSHIFGFYRATANSEYKMTGTSTAVGAGKINTEMLVRTMEESAYKTYEKGGDTTSDYAAKNCADYTSGGYSDWFLPSKDELDLIYDNLHLNAIGSFRSYYYWSSSENSGFDAWVQSFSDGLQFNYFNRNNSIYVRPVRAF